jgi:hypothetical protein
MRTLRLIIVAFAIGCAFGFLGAWVDHQGDISTYRLSGPSVSQSISHVEIYPFWEWITSPLSLPGDFVAIARHPQDWLIDEEWDYRWKIALGNGVIYSTLCCLFLGIRSLVRFIGRWLTLRTSHAR